MNSSIRNLNSIGQSVWLDNLTRNLVLSGKLKNLIDKGLTGITTDPVTLYTTLDKSNEYDFELRSYIKSGGNFFLPSTNSCYTPTIYDHLVIQDVIKAADLLLPVYTKTNGFDGYVSIDLDPAVSYRVPHTMAQARWFWHQINRPNLMIKIPATVPGIESIRRLIHDGINVNATLIFSLEQYEQVSQAYIDGIKDRVNNNLDVRNVRSVASFSASKIDSIVDTIIERLDLSSTKFKEVCVRGFAGIAIAQIINDIHRIVFDDRTFEELSSYGASPQKLLWSSICVQDDIYEVLKYVRSLAGANTIISLPWNTLDTLMKTSPKIQNTIDTGVGLAYDFVDEWLHSLFESDGLVLKDLEGELLHSGLELLSFAYDDALGLLDRRMAHFRESGGVSDNGSESRP